jgi:hypothetical protein
VPFSGAEKCVIDLLVCTNQIGHHFPQPRLMCLWRTFDAQFSSASSSIGFSSRTVLFAPRFRLQTRRSCRWLLQTHPYMFRVRSLIQCTPTRRITKPDGRHPPINPDFSDLPSSETKFRSSTNPSSSWRASPPQRNDLFSDTLVPHEKGKALDEREQFWFW